MRWERLFIELEAQAEDLEIQQRDALVDELVDGEWAGTTWRSLLGGAVVLDVIGVGRVEGEAVLVNDEIVQVHAERADHVISGRAIAAIRYAERRADPPTPVSSALGWGHVFRALRDQGEPVRMSTFAGSTIDGAIDVVGADFVRVRDESGRDQMLPFSAVAVVSGRR